MSDECKPAEKPPLADEPLLAADVLPADEPCPKCEGSGLNAARSRHCSACLGSGKRTERPYGWQ